MVLGPATGRGSLADAYLLVEGWYWSQNSGESVAGGDIDADGDADLAIGAPYECYPVHSDPIRCGGMVHLFYGPLSGVTTTDRADRHIQAEGETDHFGYRVSLADGFMDDGGAELLVGATGNVENGNWTGALYLFTDL